MSPQAVNPGGDTREKLAICERLLRLFKPETDAGELRTINDAIDTIEALVEAVEKCRDFLIHEAGFEDDDEPLKSLLAALSRARNGGQP